MPEARTLTMKDAQPIRTEQVGFRGKLAEVLRKAGDARKEGKAADMQEITVGRRALEYKLKQAVERVGGGEEAVYKAASRVVRGAEMGARVAVGASWTTVIEAGTRTEHALENLGRFAFDKVKYPAIIAATPVVAVGFAVEQTAIGLREAGIHTAKKFEDAKAGVREFFSRGNEARKAAADAFRLVPDSQGQKFLRSKFEEQKSMRNAEYGRQLAAVRAKSPVSALRNALGGVLK